MEGKRNYVFVVVHKVQSMRIAVHIITGSTTLFSKQYLHTSMPSGYYGRAIIALSYTLAQIK
jgi:hypothetical protein